MPHPQLPVTKHNDVQPNAESPAQILLFLNLLNKSSTQRFTQMQHQLHNLSKLNEQQVSPTLEQLRIQSAQGLQRLHQHCLRLESQLNKLKAFEYRQARLRLLFMLLSVAAWIALLIVMMEQRRILLSLPQRSNHVESQLVTEFGEKFADKSPGILLKGGH